jgi:8-oxo-dGTP pyrophosphatase MutT (NUDIX family)
VNITPIFRPTARILVAEPAGRVLLFSARAEADGHRWWLTPGGGVHRGETVEAAGVRELSEETGYRVTEAELGPVVATSTSWWRAGNGRTVLGAHSFFFLRVPHTALDTDGREEYEHTFLTGHRWWSVADLRAATEAIAPPATPLADLMERLLSGDIPDRPVRLSRLTPATRQVPGRPHLGPVPASS